MLKKYFFLFLFAVEAVFSCGCRNHKEVPCENFKYGFRRIFTTQAIVEGIDFEPHFEKQFTYAETLREQLIRDHVFGTTDKDVEKEINSDSARNVASFAFVFFDENTKQIGDFQYFRPNPNKDNVKNPFFFFSGRSHRTYKNTDKYEWEALSEAAIKEEDGRMLDAFIPEKRINSFRGIHSIDYIDILERNQTNFRNELRVFLWNTCKKEPFFDYLKKRDERVSISGELCKTFSDITIPKVEKLSLSKPYNNESHYRPKEDTKYFTHSEQFALYRMGHDIKTFTKFIEACRDLLDTQWITVKKLAILIYTRNTMCVRCSHSIITDFCHSDTPLLSNNTFPGQVSAVFLGSARFPYQSHTEKTDSFERFLRGVSSQPHDETYDPGKIFVPKFEDSPKGIYHHHLISLPSQITNEQLIALTSTLPSVQKSSIFRQENDLENSLQKQLNIDSIVNEKSDVDQKLTITI